MIAATTTSARILFSLSGERTSTGRCYTALKSVNGKGTSTTSPWLKLVVDGILGIIPEFERRFSRSEPCNIVRLNFQVRWQIVYKPHLVAHIQVLDRFADFLDRAHAGNLPQALLDASSPLRRKNSSSSFSERSNSAIRPGV